MSQGKRQLEEQYEGTSVDLTKTAVRCTQLPTALLGHPALYTPQRCLVFLTAPLLNGREAEHGWLQMLLNTKKCSGLLKYGQLNLSKQNDCLGLDHPVSFFLGLPLPTALKRVGIG